VDGPVVALSDVSAAYEGERVAALHEVTFCVCAGEQIAIVGPNGAGKTTLLEVINGLLPVVSGDVKVFDQVVSRRSHRLRAGIAYVPQDTVFPPDTPFLVRDVVLAARFGRSGALRWPSTADRAVARSALDALGIAELGGRPVGRLSGGQQRRVLLARALAQRAALLLLDEPTANLDSESKVEVARLVCEIRRDLDATALVVSHEGGQLLEQADRVVTLVAGWIVKSAAEEGH